MALPPGYNTLLSKMKLTAIPLTQKDIRDIAIGIAVNLNADAVEGNFRIGARGLDDEHYEHWIFENTFVAYRVWQGGNCKSCIVVTDKEREEDDKGNVFIVAQK